MAFGVDLPPALDDLLRAQDGVVSRRQLLAIGLTKPRVETLVRRRVLTAVHPGVYVDHTGAPTYAQRCWAAVLYAEPAALAGDHALPDPPTSAGVPIEVAVDWSRRVRTRRGIRVVRMRDLDAQVSWNRSPPRVHLETAAVMAADRARTDHEAIALLCQLVGARRTTAGRLATSLATRTRHSRRRLVTALVEDLAAARTPCWSTGSSTASSARTASRSLLAARRRSGAGAARSTATPTSRRSAPTSSSTAATTTPALSGTAAPTATCRTSRAGWWCRG